MMEKEKKFLSDIDNSIRLVQLFIQDTPSFERYKADPKTKGAVERHLSIIGEALNQYLKLSPENTLENAKQIIGLRNRVIHAYDSLDDRIIWSVIQNHLLPLKKEVENKLKGTT